MWWQRSFTALDTETTGLDWNDDRVIQVGLSYFSNGQYLGGHNHLINSGKSSCEEAINTHHITDEMQESLGQSPNTVFPLVRNAIAGSNFLVIMNAPFDLNFLKQEFERLNYIELPIKNIIDPLVIDRFYSRNRIPSLARGKRTLKALSERYGIHDYPLHDAGHDSRRVGELAIEMAQRNGQFGRSPLGELMKKQRTWHNQWCDEFSNFSDAKGFVFKRTSWPMEDFKWRTDQLPLDLRVIKSPNPKIRRAMPSRTNDR